MRGIKLKRKKPILLSFSLFTLVTILTACSVAEGHENKNGESGGKKESDRIHVAVVGKMPDIIIDENKVRLTSADLDTLNQEERLSYDAILVMENKLKDAANEKYKGLYLESGIPVFFVKSEASHLPFIDYDLTYDEYVNRVGDQDNFIVGILKEKGKEGMKGWKFPYPVVDSKMLKDDENTEQIYNNLFIKIEKISSD